MASRIKHGTLVANTVSTVNLDPGVNKVEILNRGSADIFVTVDESPVTVLGDDCEIVQAGFSVVVAVGSSLTVISLISAGSPAFTVCAVN